MSTIFETGIPMFTGIAPADTTERYLYYSVLEPSFTEKVMKMFESPVSADGMRTWKHKGKYATFEVLIHLHKFDSVPLTSPYNSAKSVAKMLLPYEDTDVYFYPFFNPTNYLGIKDSGGVLVPCHVVSIDFNFLKKPGNTYDVCTIVFKTNKFYDINKIILT